MHLFLFFLQRLDRPKRPKMVLISIVCGMQRFGHGVCSEFVRDAPGLPTVT